MNYSPLTDGRIYTGISVLTDGRIYTGISSMTEFGVILD
jgi:hypothetical protein